MRLEHGDVDDAAVDRVHGVTGGNALFVKELLRVRGTPSDARMPDGLRAVLDEHLARIDAEARGCLQNAPPVLKERDLVER